MGRVNPTESDQIRVNPTFENWEDQEDPNRLWPGRTAPQDVFIRNHANSNDWEAGAEWVLEGWGSRPIKPKQINTNEHESQKVERFAGDA